MIAFLTVDMLRAHDVPVFPRDILGRPVLGARWLLAPDGQLTCRWQTGGSAPLDIPPD
jgi:hypothetical protein